MYFFNHKDHSKSLNLFNMLNHLMDWSIMCNVVGSLVEYHTLFFNFLWIKFELVNFTYFTFYLLLYSYFLFVLN